MPTPELIITIAPDRDGNTMLHVSLRDADGTLTPARRIPVELDRKLETFVANMQVFARAKLAALETPAMGATAGPDGNPAIAVETTHSEQAGQQL